MVIRMFDTLGYVLSPGRPLCERSGPTFIEVSQNAYLSYQAFGLPLIYQFTTMFVLQPDVPVSISIYVE